MSGVGSSGSVPCSREPAHRFSARRCYPYSRLGLLLGHDSGGVFSESACRGVGIIRRKAKGGRVQNKQWAARWAVRVGTRRCSRRENLPGAEKV